MIDDINIKILINNNNDWFCYDRGQFHREEGPAVIYANGDRYWYIRGKLHRKNGPAVERADGSKAWLHKGVLHRLDGPAIENVNNRNSLNDHEGLFFFTKPGEHYYIFGELYTKNDYINYIVNLKNDITNYLNTQTSIYTEE